VEVDKVLPSSDEEDNGPIAKVISDVHHLDDFRWLWVGRASKHFMGRLDNRGNFAC
jgi:hypothetical protein